MTFGYGTGGYGGGFPFGSAPAAFSVSSASAVDGTHVQLTFNAPLDFTLPAIFSPANYAISPLLSILSVEEAGPFGITITTSPQSAIPYTVTVTAARSVFGSLLDPMHNTAIFTGIPQAPGYFAVATAATRVRAVFAQVMLNDSNLSNAANYTVTDLNGNPVAVSSAVPEQASNPLSVLLTLGSNLSESGSYVCTLSASIHTATGFSVFPLTSVFRWFQGLNQFQIPLGLFTGEVEGGLLGDPDGLVFFSPALNVSTANSIIQVDEVDVCSTAYDTYVMPAPIDPPTLYTFGGGLVPTPSPDPYLLNQAVCWAPFPRNFEARFEFGFPATSYQEQMPVPVDNACSVLMKQPFALGYVALLNDPAWFLFDNKHGTSVPPTFITAKNLSPIPSGPESILILHVQMSGSSRFGPSVAKKVGHTSVSMSGSSKLEAGAGPPPVKLAHASVSAGSTMTAVPSGHFVGAASIGGQATVNALAVEGNPLPTVLFGSSSLVPFATVTRAVAASLGGSSGVAAHATVTRGAGASLAGSGAVASLAIAHWAGHATPGGAATVAPAAKVVHKAEAFLLGGSTVIAVPT